MRLTYIPGGSDGKESAYNAETWVWSLGWEDSPGEGNGNPLQYSCPENSMDRRAWQATVHKVHGWATNTCTFNHFTYNMASKMLYSKSAGLNVNLVGKKNSFIKTSGIMCNQTFGYSGLAKLTHKINDCSLLTFENDFLNSWFGALKNSHIRIFSFISQDILLLSFIALTRIL